MLKLTCANRVVHKCVPLFLVLALTHATTGQADVYNVSSTADSGVNTLRNAILLANADVTPPHTITILIAGDGPHTISLLSALPAITRQTAISASGEAISGAPGVRLMRGAVFNAPGLQFAGTADNSSVSWLSITDFTGSSTVGYGIDIMADATSVSVSNCYVGIAPDGVTDAGNASSGIHVAGGSAVIGNGSATRNVISGNGQSGIVVDGGGSLSVIKGNRIGTNAAGTAAIANAVHGINGVGGDDVFIGGLVAGDGNLISGNGSSGVSLSAGAGLWRVRGNFIGTTADGATALKNNAYGIVVAGDNHIIGFTDSTGRNVISGNNLYGINLIAGADNTTIRANYIGINALGTASLGTQQRGISVTGTVTGCVIGGTAAGHRNVISGHSVNGAWGILTDNNVSGCVISGNYIGLNAAGDAAVANTGGVQLQGSSMVLGGVTAGERNVISGNTNNGVSLFGSNNVVKGNYIGTNTTGTAAIGNGTNGIGVAATGGTIGGTTASDFNLISGNGSAGISTNGGTTALVIAGNYIGTNLAGSAALPNGYVGVWLGGTGNTLGGTTVGSRNFISGNHDYGVLLQGTGNIIQGNFIGTNVGGTAAVANGSYGIRVITAESAVIGGAVAGAGNLISGNTSNGIGLDGDTNAATISGNLIGTNAAGTGAVPNGGSGIAIAGSNHVVGGTTPAARNVISGNVFQGVVLSGTGSIVRGNYIGTNAAGTGAVGNNTGIRAITSTDGTIGGTAAGAGNLISGNSSRGIYVDSDTDSLVITGNLIGTNAAGTAAVPNVEGVRLAGTGNTLGGTAAGARNVISGNTQTGVTVDDDSSLVVITGNYVGTNALATAAVGNGGSGVGLDGTNNILGGNTAAARNLISGNSGGGVVLGGMNNVVRGNYIGTNPAGDGAIGNGGYGIRVYEATGGEVGGADVADGNLVSGNGRGISLEENSTGNVLRNNVIGLNAAMTAKVPNHGSGVEVYTSGNTIGAPGTPPDGNVIAGNDFQGIFLGSLASGNTIQGNWIGTNKGSAAALGNVQVGIFIEDANDNTFGGAAAGAGNVIAYNQFIGVLINRGDGNDFSRNSIFENGLLGLDIGQQGLVANDDEDPDISGNERQNFPLLTSVVSGGGTEIDGILQNEPDTQYRVEFFTSPNCDNTGFGEGKTYFATVNVTTGPDGSGVIDASMPPTAAPFMSATATDPEGNTSEFSPCAKTTGPNPGTIQFYRSAVLSYEGVLPTGEAVITRSHGMAGTVTVNFTVSNLTAFAGTDYVDSDQVVTFLDGEVLKVIEIPIIVDPAAETDPEHANLALTTPTGGALLGLAASDLYIFDQNLEYPGIIVEDASITEGNAGQQNLTFDVTLSPSDHAVSVVYLTEPGTAVAGQDYTHVTGTVDFLANAATQTQTVNVPISGDVAIEEDEVVWLRITCGPDCSTWIAYDVFGLGLILNDDSGQQQSEIIFKDSFENLPP